MLRSPHKLQDTHRRIRIRRQRIPQIRIEIRQSRTVYDHIKILLQPPRHLRIQPQPRLRDVALHHFNFFSQILREPRPILFKQRIEYRRLLHHLLEPPLCRIRFLPPDQQINPPDLRQLHQRIRQPDLANKSGHSDQHHMPARQRPPHRKPCGLPLSLEMHNRPFQRRRLPPRPNHRPPQLLERNIQLPRQGLRRPPPIRTLLSDSRECSPRPDHRLQQPSRRHAVAKLQPIRHHTFHSEMLRQRLHHVFQPLTHQHHIRAGAHQFPHSFRPVRLQLRFQFVLEIFLTQQVQPVPRHAPQRRVHHARRKLAVRRIKKRSQHRHQQNQPPPLKTLRKSLRVPRKERHRLHHRQVQQASLHPPVHGRRSNRRHSCRHAGGYARFVVRLFQSILRPRYSVPVEGRRISYCKQCHHFRAASFVRQDEFRARFPSDRFSTED